jgi:hypothetical protein
MEKRMVKYPVLMNKYSGSKVYKFYSKNYLERIASVGGNFMIK